jgi:hypothetical protein
VGNSAALPKTQQFSVESTLGSCDFVVLGWPESWESRQDKLGYTGTCKAKKWSALGIRLIAIAMPLPGYDLTRRGLRGAKR